jgi:hypothetical protein
MSHEWSRLRLLLADAFSTIVIVLVILALIGGWFTYTTHAVSATHLEERTVAEWESTGEFSHSATVTNGSEAFPAGTTLSNQSIYFTSIAPVLNGTFTYTYTGSSGDITVNTTLTYVLHSVEETSNGNATEYWSITRSLDSQKTDSLAPGETQRITFSININATQQQANQIEEDIGGTSGTVGALVVAQTTINGTIEGRTVSQTRRYVMPIEFSEGQYNVHDPGTITNQSEVTRQISVATTFGPLRSTGSVLLLFVSLWLLIGLAVARQQGMLDIAASERERLEMQAAREEFEEWITTARLPDTLLDTPHAEVDSLEDLVDLAIDTNRRVIEDPHREGYFVLSDNVCYTYIPSLPEDSEFQSN